MPSSVSQPGSTTTLATAVVIDETGVLASTYEHLLDRSAARYLRCQEFDPVQLHALINDIADPSCLIYAFGPDSDPLEIARTLCPMLTGAAVPLLLVGPPLEADAALALIDAGAFDYLPAPVDGGVLATRVAAASKLRAAWQDFCRANERRGELSTTLLAVLELTTGLNHCQDEEQVVAMAAEQLTAFLGARGSAILLVDPITEELGFSQIYETGTGEIPADWRVDHRPHPDATVHGVFRDAQTRRIPEPETQPARDEEATSPALLVPLVSPGTDPGSDQHVIGVAWFHGRYGIPVYRDEEIPSIELLCSAVAAAVLAIRARHTREQARDSIVAALVELTEARDNNTGRHLDRVTTFAVLLAEELRGHPRFPEINDAFIDDLRRATPLHDVGKVAVPDSILLKSDRLTDEEMEIMRTHAGAGAECLRSVRERFPNSRFMRTAEEIARYHHERFDGRGYPEGLSGHDIPLPARIVALADVYDALTTRRVYKEPISHAAAADIIIQQKGRHFDPLVVEAFERQVDRFRELAEALGQGEASANGFMPPLWYLSTRAPSMRDYSPSDVEETE